MAASRRRVSAALSISHPALSLRFWGVRGSVAVPGPSTVRYGGNTACIELRSGQDLIILDAGTGIRELGKQLAREFARRAGRVWILITHTHWDHIQGFPFFAPAYHPRNRIRILGWRGSRAGLARTVASAVESPFFPVALRQMPGSITFRELDGYDFRVGAFRGRAALLNHPGGGVGFRLESSDGSVAYVPDHEVVRRDGAVAKAGHRSLTAAERRSRERTDAMCELIRDVDVLIHDAQYTAEEYAVRIGWGHSCVDAVVAMSAEYGVRRLVLFHHDPDRDDAQLDVILKRARQQAESLGASMTVDVAKEGMEIHLQEGRCRLASPRRTPSAPPTITIRRR